MSLNILFRLLVLIFNRFKSKRIMIIIKSLCYVNSICFQTLILFFKYLIPWIIWKSLINICRLFIKRWINISLILLLGGVACVEMKFGIKLTYSVSCRPSFKSHLINRWYIQMMGYPLNSSSKSIYLWRVCNWIANLTALLVVFGIMGIRWQGGGK